MTTLPILLLLALTSVVAGLSIVAKTDFEDAASTSDSEPSGSENKAGDYLVIESKNRTNGRIREYIPIVLKRSNRRIEARIPIIISTGKATATERSVPIVRGAAVPTRSDQREIASENIEGLRPPSKSSTDRWYLNQESNGNGDSNNYYPNVNGPYTSTPRPVYGVPSPNPSRPSWNNNCPSWGPQTGGNYPPSYPTNQGDYPPYNNNYPQYPSNQYPMNNYPSHQRPPNQGNNGNNGWGNNPSWQNSNWGSQSWNSQQSGRWVPCGPVDLNNPDGQRRPTTQSGCSQISRASNPIRFDPPASPASKIDDKTQFNRIPDDVEEITP